MSGDSGNSGMPHTLPLHPPIHFSNGAANTPTQPPTIPNYTSHQMMYNPYLHSHHLQSQQAICHQTQLPTATDQSQQNKMTFSVEFNRDKMRINKKYKGLFEAVKNMDGMKNWKIIKINITKIEGDSDYDDDDDDDDIFRINNNSNNKQESVIDTNIISDSVSNPIQQSTAKPNSKTTTDINSKETESKESTAISDDQYERVIKFSLINSEDNRTNKTAIKGKKGVNDDISGQIFEQLKELEMMVKPGSCHYKFAENIFCGEEILCRGKMQRSKINANLRINDEKIQKIYDNIKDEVNEKRPIYLKSLGSKAKGMKNMKKTKKRELETNQSDLPPTKKQKLCEHEPQPSNTQNDINNDNTDNSQ